MHDYNLLPLTVQAFGWALAGTFMLLSLMLLGLVYVHRDRQGQPTNLFGPALCGNLHNGRDLDSPGSGAGRGGIGRGLHVLPLVLADWLLRGLFGAPVQNDATQPMDEGGPGDATVEPRDVAWTTALWLGLNVGLLLGWTIVAPLKYIRVDTPRALDVFGRATESTGACHMIQENNGYYLKFGIPIGLVNVLGVAGATYQTYQARHFSTTLSESKYLALAMASLMECMLLGGPVLFATVGGTAFHVVASLLLATTISAILVPIFLPKYLHRNAKPQASDMMRPASGNTAGISRLDPHYSTHSVSTAVSRPSAGSHSRHSAVPRNSKFGLASFGNLEDSYSDPFLDIEQRVSGGMTILKRDGVLTQAGIQRCARRSMMKDKSTTGTLTQQKRLSQHSVTSRSTTTNHGSRSNHHGGDDQHLRSIKSCPSKQEEDDDGLRKVAGELAKELEGPAQS